MRIMDMAGLSEPCRNFGSAPALIGVIKACGWRAMLPSSPDVSTIREVQPVTSKVRKLEPREAAARLNTPTDLSDEAIQEVTEALNGLLADTFALYVKTKNFHWHVSGPHFRDYHLLLDEQAAQIEGSVDILAERVRKIGGSTIRSIGHIAKLQRVKDNDEEIVLPGDMLCELMADNKAQIQNMREAHKLADEHEDVATASLLEVFIDEAEKRCWFLFEASRGADRSGH
jgi:starvation-inducible DNA-binding protein